MSNMHMIVKLGLMPCMKNTGWKS